MTSAAPIAAMPAHPTAEMCSPTTMTANTVATTGSSSVTVVAVLAGTRANP